MRTSESKGHYQLYDSSAPFEPEVRNRSCGTTCANFGFGALAQADRERKRWWEGAGRGSSAGRDQTAMSSAVSSVNCWTLGASATVLSLLRYGRAAATAEIPMSP